MGYVHSVSFINGTQRRIQQRTQHGQRRSTPRRARLAVLAAVTATALAVSGCAPADPFEDIPEFTVDRVEVTMTSDGDGDKRVLSYATANATQDATVTVSYGVNQNAVATEKVSADAPAGGDVEQVTLPLDVTVDDDGQATATVGEPAHSNLDVGKEALTAAGFQVRWHADSSGNVTQLQLLPPSGSSDDGRATVERALLHLISTAPVFPAEPVGPGATWTATSRTMGETSMKRTVDYTLDRLDGDTAELSLVVKEEPAKKDLDIDGQGQRLTAETWTTTSQAKVRVNLTQPVPVDGQNAATTRIVYAGPNPDFKVVQDVTTATTYGKRAI